MTDFTYRWIDEHCICATCVHGIDRDLFGMVLCEQSGMAGGWNPGTSCCEEHYFSDQAMQIELECVMDEWYEREFGCGKLEEIMENC